jgi:hypothetical protein
VVFSVSIKLSMYSCTVHAHSTRVFSFACMFAASVLLFLRVYAGNFSALAITVTSIRSRHTRKYVLYPCDHTHTFAPPAPPAPAATHGPPLLPRCGVVSSRESDSQGNFAQAPKVKIRKIEKNDKKMTKNSQKNLLQRVTKREVFTQTCAFLARFCYKISCLNNNKFI